MDQFIFDNSDTNRGIIVVEDIIFSDNHQTENNDNHLFTSETNESYVQDSVFEGLNNVVVIEDIIF